MVSGLQSSVSTWSSSINEPSTPRPSVLPHSMTSGSSKDKAIPLYLDLLSKHEDLENINQVFIILLANKCIVKVSNKKQKKSSLYSRYYVEVCNEWWGQSPRFSALATLLRINVAAVAILCPSGAVIEPRTSRSESDVFDRFDKRLVK